MSYFHFIQTLNNNSNSHSLLRAAIFGRNVKVTLLRSAIWSVTIVIVWKLALTPIRVSGISMFPAYHDREINVINHLAYVRHEPRRGDVVAIRFSPETSGWFKTPRIMLLKRIVGLPGETVAFVNGKIFINGKILDEPYETGLQCDWTLPSKTLAADEYFVVGDNREMPAEDHTKGRCKRSQIVGRILL